MSDTENLNNAADSGLLQPRLVHPLNFEAAVKMKLRMTDLAGTKQGWKLYTLREVHYVYALLDVGGEVVYIGETNEIGRRIRQHKKTGKIFSHFAVAEASSYAEALKLEKTLIRKYRPLHNLTHNYS